MSCYTADAAALREAGYRLTPQRLMVLEALYHHDGYANAEEIWERVCAQSPHVELSTVYRSVHFLHEQGLVSELRSLEGPTVYAANRESPHAHAVCRRCAAVSRVELGWMDELAAHLLAVHGFHIEGTSVEVPGLCAACATEAQSAERKAERQRHNAKA